MKLAAVCAVVGAALASPQSAAQTREVQKHEQTNSTGIKENRTEQLLAVKHTGTLKPPLDPKSDSTFFKHDYPKDSRPKSTVTWEGPYPKLQNSSRFHDDYVTDENHDSGHWATQMKYDTLKHKVYKQNEAVKKALAKKEKEREEADAASEEGKKADAKVADAEKEAEAAAKEAEEAETELQKAMGKDGSRGKLSDAEERVKAAQLNLDGCQKRLSDAEAELERVMAEHKAHAAEHKDEAKKVDEASAKHEVAKKDAKAAAAEADAASATAEKERREHERAQSAYEKEKSKADKTNDELEETEKRLRKLRGEKVAETAEKDDKVNALAEKSGAASRSFAIFALGLALCMAK